MTWELHHGDALEFMATLPDASVDAIITDPPYGTTACSWDSIVPLPQMWEAFGRIAKPNAAMVLTASQPFTTTLINSNLTWFRYEWIWEKTIATNFMVASKRPAKKHENVTVFYRQQPTYNPQMERGEPYRDVPRERRVGVHGDAVTRKAAINNDGSRFPSSVQRFSNGNNGTQHPTQKPISLMTYLVRTYSNSGDTILDPFAGSGSTGVAALTEGRNFIGSELEAEYHAIATRRLETAAAQPRLLELA